MNATEEIALGFLPQSLSAVVKRSMALYKGNVSELRLRAQKPVYITANNKNINCGVICSYSDIDYTVRSLCGNSLYSHSESIKEGYICTEGGIRAGIWMPARPVSHRVCSGRPDSSFPALSAHSCGSPPPWNRPGPPAPHRCRP